MIDAHDERVNDVVEAMDYATVERLAQDDPGFLQDLRRLKPLWREHKSKQVKFRETLAALYAPYKTEMEPIYALIKNRKKAKLQELRQHADCIAVKRSSASYSAKVRAIFQRWGVEQYALSRFIRRNPQLKLTAPINRYNPSHGRLWWTVLRKFRSPR